ncbi:MAG: DJ-1/PfpI family protein [Clostridia bacterium]|nr:DJ-1/PfpI family protein [Clostridia bacterium]
MVKVAVLIANGTEEIEALTPVDVLRRAGVECDLVSVNGTYPIGSHGITVKEDKTIDDVDLLAYGAIVVPGGMPGATNIADNSKVINALKNAMQKNKVVAAICASPAVVLATSGFIDGKTATCYPAQAFIEMMSVTNYTGADVEVDGNVITANGPKSAMKFALAICQKLGVNPKF